MNYLGDFTEDATVYLMFNTFTSNDPSASSTITNFANTDVHIHKDDGLTQRNNAAGITVSVNFDGITGSHMVKIDTSDNTVAGFWVVGKDYFVRIEGTTVDAGTINAVVGHFSIENRHNKVDVVKWLGQACHAVSENGVPKVDLDQIGGVAQSLTDLKDLVDTGYDPTTHKVQGVVLADTVTTYTGNTKQTANNNTILSHTDYGNAKLVRATTPANKLDVSGTGEAGLDFANIKNATGAHTLTNITVPTCTTNTDMRGTDGANTTVPDAVGTAPTASEIQTQMEGAGSKLLAIETDTNELQTDWVNSGRLDLLLDAIPTTAMRGTDNAATETKQDIIDTLVDRILDATEARVSSVNDVGATTTKFISNLAEATNDYWNRMAILFTSGQNDGQMRRIKDYAGATKEITLQTPLSFAPANADTFVICTVRAFITPDIEDIADAVLDELTADHTIAGSLSKAIGMAATPAEVNAEVVDVLKTDTVTEMAQGAPPASPTIEQILNCLYRKLRNKTETTASEDAVYNDAGDTKLYKAVLADDSTTMTKNEYGSGA